MRVRLQATAASLYSLPTLSFPRVRNCRMPGCCLSTPNTAFTTALRRAYTARPAGLRSFGSSRSTAACTK